MSLYDLFFRCVTLSYPSIDGAANYALVREGDALNVFFEGSNGEEDWRVNLDFPARAYKRGARTAWFAHRGFLELWKTTEPYISGALLDPTVKKLTVVGYSHGGALAMLCHEYVWFNRPDLRHNVTGYGFGAPRVFWGAPTRSLAQRWQGFTVVRNLDDAVTHLPPKLLGYSHVGNLLEIGEAGRYSAIDAHRAENILYQLKIYESGI
ncbi:MAG: lipase family protein [Clostridia bacterium]|nr:lipase family protein [Clostridia bacterium]